MVNEEKPYLACSPDDLVHNDLLVTLMCPCSARNQHISSNSVPHLLKDANGTYFLQMGTTISTKFKGSFCDAASQMSPSREHVNR